MMGDISGTVKLFLQGESGMILMIFWIGVLSLFTLVAIFILLVKYTHKKIDALKDIS